jgi:hypothetical protein
MPMQRGARNSATPSNKCIYCGLTENDEVRLSDEHVVPDGLGWDLVIPKASCQRCQRIINPFEQDAVKSWFGIQRELFGLQSKKGVYKKGYKSENHIGSIVAESSDFLNMHPQDIHLAGRGQGGAHVSDVLNNGGFYPVFALPPGVIYGRNQDEILPYSIISLNESLKMQNYVVSARLNPANFFRLIAKIAHCFAVLFGQNNNIEYCLEPFILGNDWSRASYWIGISEVDFPASEAHYLGIYTRKIPKFESIGIHEILAVVVSIGLFAGFGAPTYDVVVGYVKA